MKRRTALVIGGLFVIGFLFALRRLDADPPHVARYDAEDFERGAGAYELPRRDIESSRLLVTAKVPAPDPPSFAQTDWSQAWVNLFEQELGHFAHLDADAFDAERLEGKRLVCFTRPAQERLLAQDVDAIASFVERGGTLVLDRPVHAFSKLSTVALEPGARYGDILGFPQRVDADGQPVPGRLSAIASTRLGGIPPLPIWGHVGNGRDEPILALDFGERLGGIWSHRHGAGQVVALAFDLGRLLVTLQQGEPLDDFAIEKTIGFYEQVLETHDLLWDSSFNECTSPAADVIERLVLAIVREERALPTWWAFPDLAPGALLMTHDEDMQSAASCDLLLDHEREIGADSTYLLIPFPRMADLWSDADVTRYADAGADLQLHWNRLPMPEGVWKIEPWERVYSLEEQIDMLVERLGERPDPLINRNHYLMWESVARFSSGDTDWAHTFRVMCEQGIDLDSTYGPNRKGRGYLFGTGRPYRPLDTDGTVLPILELPFVSQENWGGESEDWWRNLFRESRDFYHCAIACIIHPHLIVREREGNALWKTIHRLANDADHVALTLADYWRFLEARRESSLVETLDEDGVLTIALDAKAEGMALDFRTRDNVAYEVDGAIARDLRHITVDGLYHVLVPVPAGRSTVRVIRAK